MNILTKAKWMLWMFGHFQVPLIGYTKAEIIDITDERVIVRIKLRRRTKNHLHSMYMGALAIGADIAGGLLAVYFAQRSKAKISLAFKSFHAEFIKRPEHDVYFICEQGKSIQEMIARAKSEKTRINQIVPVEAYTHFLSEKGKEKVADFKLELSLKVL